MTARMMVAMVNANDSDARVLVVWWWWLRLLLLVVVDGSPVVDVEIPSWCVCVCDTE